MLGHAVLHSLSMVECCEAKGVSRRDGFDATATGPLYRWIAGAHMVVNCVAVLRSDQRYGTAEYVEAAAGVNSVWPARLARVAQEVGCKVVHISSDAVFAHGSRPVSETSPVGPSEPYGLSKALGEVVAENVLNLRLSVIGPSTAGTRRSLWNWLCEQPAGAVVQGYQGAPWAGCTSAQVGRLVADLVRGSAFDTVRAAGSTQHFVPNGTSTKYEVLSIMARRFRPDLMVVPTAPPARVLPPLSTETGALEQVFTGWRGWEAAIGAYAQPYDCPA